MSRAIILIAAIPLALSMRAVSQPAMQAISATAPMPTRAVRHLMKTANKPAKDAKLAAYFYQREAQYRAEAIDEMAGRDRAPQVNAGLYGRYPRPVDAAEALYESYLSSANDAANKARELDQFAGGAALHRQ
jgi:hypothetical protein